MGNLHAIGWRGQRVGVTARSTSGMDLAQSQPNGDESYDQIQIALKQTR